MQKTFKVSITFSLHKYDDDDKTSNQFTRVYNATTTTHHQKLILSLLLLYCLFLIRLYTLLHIHIIFIKNIKLIYTSSPLYNVASPPILFALILYIL